MKILVTGAAGFIGFHLCRKLLDLGHQVLGIDNLNDYYDVTLKQARLSQLVNHPNFEFQKLETNKLSQTVYRHSRSEYLLKSPYSY